MISKDLCRRYFYNNGLKISYLDNNQVSTEIPIFMLHGFTASSQSNWGNTGWIKDLTEKKRRVIAIDARGHGKSNKPYDAKYYPSNIMMEDSISLMSELGFSKVDFIGYSMGARMSVFAAIKYPEKIRKLVLGGMGINFIKGMNDTNSIAEGLLIDDYRKINNLEVRKFRLIAERENNDLQALSHCILSSRQIITKEDLLKIKSQVLILVGENDLLSGSADDLCLLIRNSRAMTVAKCNHFNALFNNDFRREGVNFIS